MSNDNDKSVLGRGLSTLISEATIAAVNRNENKSNDIQTLSINKIIFNTKQPRKNIDHEELQELAASIAEHGILQPILVRKIDENTYQIIAGERRYHAAQKVGLKEIPVIIKNYNDSDSLEIALVENIQRQDLNALEEAFSYNTLLEEYGHTQESIARKLGKSRSYIANTLRLNKLPEEIKKLLINKKITPGHAKAIASSDDPIDLARTIIEHNLNVRDTEKLIRKLSSDQQKKIEKNNKNTKNNTEDLDIKTLEKELCDNLKLKVNIQNKNGKYKITIDCGDDLDNFDLIVAKLSGGGNMF